MKYEEDRKNLNKQKNVYHCSLNVKRKNIVR
jgi:hypothetical protein